MRAENFFWMHSVSIEFGGVELDLHNCYSFRHLGYNVRERFVVLQWERMSAEWVPQGIPAAIKLTMKRVYDFRFEPRDPNMPFTEDDCLASFGYACDEKWASEGQFWVDDSPEAQWRWSFIFQSGAELQVAGESASLSVKV